MNHSSISAKEGSADGGEILGQKADRTLGQRATPEQRRERASVSLSNEPPVYIGDKPPVGDTSFRRSGKLSGRGEIELRYSNKINRKSPAEINLVWGLPCLLYTSDAADE